MEHELRIRATGLAVVVVVGAAVSLITSTVVAGRAYERRARQAAVQQQVINVKGSAKLRVTSDLAVWRIDVRGHGEELADAYAVLERGSAGVSKFLAQHGFVESEFSLSAIDTNVQYGRDQSGNLTNEIKGYMLSRSFVVRSVNVWRVNDAAGRVTDLLSDGVQVASARPEFTYSKVANIKVQILGEATKDAKIRGEEIAKNSGCRLADVRSAQMGVVQVTQPDSTEVASYGIYDTSTIEKDVSVVVTLSVGLEPL